jgi:hypothetical protein
MTRSLKSIVLGAASPDAASWFENAWPDGKPLSRTRFRATFAGAGRRLGASVPTLSGADLRALVELGMVAPERWSLADLGRAALLARALEVIPASEHLDFVREVYQRGDTREQAAVLRALALLPDSRRFVDIATDACRTNVTDVFEAIACENPYPAAHFPELNFNQLVIKAIFMGVAVSGIVGLAERRTDELRRMAEDFASERRAAGRPVPDDIGLVLT